MKQLLKKLRRFIVAFLGAPSVIEINAAVYENGKRGYLADAAIATRHYLVKAGSDANHVAVCAAASDEPLGIAQDEPAAAEEGVNVAVLGAVPGTILGVAGEAITANEDVYSKGDGTLMDEPTQAGTFWKVGRSKTAQATAGQEIEFEPCLPQKVVIIAALTSTNGTAAGAADLAALKDEAEKIGDDVRAIAAALATPALVKVLA